jgi:putative hydrolase of the HAD superfamily
MQIRAVVFDYGEVLNLTPREVEVEALRKLTGLPPGDFEKYFWLCRDDYDGGVTDGGGYWACIGKSAGAHFPPGLIEELIAADVALWQRPNPVMTDWARRLREHGIKTAILSNMPLDVAAVIRRKEEWLANFDVKILSAEHRLRKPEPPIYQLCLRELAVGPHEVIFLDDRLPNVLAARELGWHAFQYGSLDRLMDDVRRFDLPALPTREPAAASPT